MNIENVNVIIIINDYTKMGGVEKVTANLSKLFMCSNFSFQGVISLNREFDNPKIKYPAQLPFFVMKTGEIKKIIQEKKITHVIIQTQLLKETLDILKQLDGLDVKKIPVLHSTPYAYLRFFYKKNNIIDFIRYLKMIFITRQRSLYFIKEIIKRSNKFLLVSKKAEEELKFILAPKYHNKISFIYNAHDIQVERNNNKENIIVYAGRLAPEKQVFKAVKLLAPILKANSNWHLEILGEGCEKNIIENFILDNNINNVFLRGSVDNVFDYLSRAKISFLYSLYEGLPTSMLEASFYNNVLVTSDSKGGVSDIVENNINGFIVNNDMEFVRKVESLIADETLAINLSNGNSRVRQKFDNTKIIKLWENLFIQ
ncbi:glycosyltransferase [Acinetobacter sp.]|jgi:glycosyltransferase involved in cell wall biosynthesis|uniref:glycosyltransferase n=1 Tax=Acinetobacter sp. TaxID=472 RepID=UPI002822CBFC|nr:glycosyltransferase [Acinetobacter sp.]MDR0234811.1 glycosyltransferase [Acinetobacter sp.]